MLLSHPFIVGAKPKQVLSDLVSLFLRAKDEKQKQKDEKKKTELDGTVSSDFLQKLKHLGPKNAPNGSRPEQAKPAKFFVTCQHCSVRQERKPFSELWAERKSFPVFAVSTSSDSEDDVEDIDIARVHLSREHGKSAKELKLVIRVDGKRVQAEKKKKSSRRRTNEFTSHSKSNSRSERDRSQTRNRANSEAQHPPNWKTLPLEPSGVTKIGIHAEEDPFMLVNRTISAGAPTSPSTSRSKQASSPHNPVPAASPITKKAFREKDDKKEKDRDKEHKKEKDKKEVKEYKDTREPTSKDSSSSSNREKKKSTLSHTLPHPSSAGKSSHFQ
eukprot:TRINITY_DN2120_c0_g1_i3.p2 TRINITY_DN2120_c0_g1~~TRINITY_DN2120_c0_g1_i3.p2  ORF type:complete len:329 (-),score=69.77 TRINITY_DN2120_c0_g1_i3:824-1810(-)